MAIAEFGRVELLTGRRADFDAFLLAARTLLAGFLSDRRAVLDDRPAVLVEWLLITSI